jgi:PKD repeat protein
MGVGYYQHEVQWSRGEYPDANNRQDDIAVIQAAGVPLRTDDYPATLFDAPPLGGNANSVAQSGLIETPADVDVFTFSSGNGNAHFIVSPDALGPNLDILAKLLDVHGNVLAQSNPENDLSATLSLSLTSGRYYLQIEGAGKGDLATGYSDYGSLGQYLITGSYVQGFPSSPPSAMISASPSTGEAPLTVALDGSESSDVDGTIARYAWNFGDGQTATGSASLSHVYHAPGNYAATLTAIDNSGEKSSATQTIEVVAAKAPGLSVSRHEVNLKIPKIGKPLCYSRVTVDNGGTPVAKARVYGTWSGSYARGKTSKSLAKSSKGYTNASGVVLLNGPRVPKTSTGTCTFSVTKIVKKGYDYAGNGTLSDGFSW